ncbi:MAG: phosphoribosyl-ATP diphosphatase [Casimicrobium sp.]
MSDDTLKRLSETIVARLNSDPATSYVAKLHSKGEDAALKKVGEECAEFIMAAKDVTHDGDGERTLAEAKLVAEAADVWFHMLVALARHNLNASDVIAELARREGVSGIDEQASRPK